MAKSRPLKPATLWLSVKWLTEVAGVTALVEEHHCSGRLWTGDDGAALLLGLFDVFR